MRIIALTTARNRERDKERGYQPKLDSSVEEPAFHRSSVPGLIMRLFQSEEVVAVTLIDKPAHVDFTDFEFWSERPDATLEDYAQERMTPELLLGFLSLPPRPDLVLHADRVFIADNFSPETLNEWIESDVFRDGGMTAVQAVLNHVHVGDFFYRAGPQVSDENIDFVARVVAAAWKGRLESAFPEREFNVDVRGDEIWISEP